MSFRTVVAHIDVVPADVPLEDAFVISRGHLTAAEVVFVAVHIVGGARGYGEAAPFAALTGETRDATLESIRNLIPLVVGRDAAEAADISRDLAAAAPEAPAARAAIECALVDAQARMLGVPLYRYWGGESAGPVITDVTLPMLEPDRVDTLARRWHGRGFRTFKLKVGSDVDAGVARVRQLAGRFPDVAFIVDANQAFNADSAVRFAEGLRPIATRIGLYEQPVPRGDIDALAQVRSACAFPVAADEAVFTVSDAQKVIRAAAADVINLKIMKSGLFATIEIAEMARKSGVGLMVGGMMETRLAMSFSLALALGRGDVRHFDLDTPLLMADDPIAGGYRYDGPRMTMVDQPGTAAVPNVFA